MIEFLLQMDKELFLFLNSLHTPVLDPIMVFISGKLSWIPLYILLLYVIIKTFKWESVRLLLFIGLLISASDQISVQAFKLVFLRLRPCHEPDLIPFIHLASGKCGGNFGFVSSHAANSFALAGFLYFLFKPTHSYIGWGMLVWAAVVSYSRIYLGVHYPADIFFGAVLGLIIAWLVWKLYTFLMEYFCSSHCKNIK